MENEPVNTQQRVWTIMELTEVIHSRVKILTIVKEIEVDPYPQGVMVTVEITNGQTIKIPLPWDIQHENAVDMIRRSARVAYGLNA